MRSTAAFLTATVLALVLVSACQNADMPGDSAAGGSSHDDPTAAAGDGASRTARRIHHNADDPDAARGAFFGGCGRATA